MSAALLAATFVALAAVLGLAPAPALARRRPPPVGPAPETTLLLRLRPPMVAITVAGGWALVGGWPGVLAGLVAGYVAWRVLGDTETTEARRRRERLAADLPLAVALLGSVLRSGASVEGALDTVGRAVGGPLAEVFAAVGHRTALGLDPVAVWRGVGDEAALAPLGAALARSYETGAAITDAIDLLSDDLRERERTETQVRAKGVEVRAAAPLGACFLPAFVLIGIVPLVVGTFGSLDFFG